MLEEGKEEGRKESAEGGFAMAVLWERKEVPYRRVTENSDFCWSLILGCWRECTRSLSTCTGWVYWSVRDPRIVCIKDCFVEQCPWNSKGFVSVGYSSSWSKCSLMYDCYLHHWTWFPLTVSFWKPRTLCSEFALGLVFDRRSIQFDLQKLGPRSLCYMMEKKSRMSSAWIVCLASCLCSHAEQLWKIFFPFAFFWWK